MPDPGDGRLRGPDARPRQRPRLRRAHDLHQAQGGRARRGHAGRRASPSTSTATATTCADGHAPGDGAAHRGLQAPARRAQRRPRPPAVRDRVRRHRRASSPTSPTTACCSSTGISTYDGVPDLIIDAAPGGARWPRRSATARALLLRNHGVLVAERDVRWAVLASALLERAVQMQAARRPRSARCIRSRSTLLAGIHAVKYQADFAGEYWDAWVRELRRSGRAFGMPGER